MFGAWDVDKFPLMTGNKLIEVQTIPLITQRITHRYAPQVNSNLLSFYAPMTGYLILQ